MSQLSTPPPRPRSPPPCGLWGGSEGGVGCPSPPLCDVGVNAVGVSVLELGWGATKSWDAYHRWSLGTEKHGCMHPCINICLHTRAALQVNLAKIRKAYEKY